MKLNWNCFQGEGGRRGSQQNPPRGSENKIQCVANAFQFNEALSSGCFKSFCCAINSMHTIQLFWPQIQQLKLDYLVFFFVDRINYLLFYGYSVFQRPER